MRRRLKESAVMIHRELVDYAWPELEGTLFQGVTPVGEPVEVDVVAGMGTGY